MAILLIFGVVALLFAGLLAHLGRKELALKKLMFDTPTTFARDVHVGFVEVKGTVEPAETFLTPFNQVQAVYCRWQVEEYRRRGKSSSWYTLMEGIQAHDFYVRDDSGRVRIAVEGHGAPILYLAGKNTTSSGAFRAAPEHIEAFLARHGRSSSGLIFNKNLRYTEECIQPGEHLYALGHAEREGMGEARLDAGQGRLILANLTEEELVRRVGRNAMFELGGSAILCLGGITMIVLGVTSLL